MRIELLKEVESTQDYIKQYSGRGENVIVCAERQKSGRGTKNRSFLSDAGGVYLSALFYPDLPAKDAFLLMAHAATAVCRTIESFNIRPAVKWANDVLIGRKKCCGILIENSLKEGKIYESVIGIGLNVSNDVSALGQIACSMKDFLKEPPRVAEVRERLIQNLKRISSFEEYLSYVGFLGQEVEVLGEESYKATVKRVLPDGRLEVERAGRKVVLSHGEISIRIGER